MHCKKLIIFWGKKNRKWSWPDQGLNWRPSLAIANHYTMAAWWLKMQIYKSWFIEWLVFLQCIIFEPISYSEFILVVLSIETSMVVAKDFFMFQIIIDDMKFNPLYLGHLPSLIWIGLAAPKRWRLVPMSPYLPKTLCYHRWHRHHHCCWLCQGWQWFLISVTL